MGRNILILVAVIAVVIIGGYFLIGQQVKDKISSSKAPTPAPTSTTGDRHSAVSEITVEVSEFQFSPSTIVAVAAKPLTITVKNVGKMPHDFSIKELKASTKVLKPGESETITVTPAKAGIYQIECTVPGHAAKGMVGMLMVQPN